MTDLPPSVSSLPARMGARWELGGGPPRGYLEVTPERCSHGVARVSTVAMLVDTAAGIVVDIGAGEDWTFTADLSFRVVPRVTGRIDAVPTIVREGGRGITVDVPLFDADGVRVGAGVSTFAKLARRPGDPPKVSFEDRPEVDWPSLDAPLVDLLPVEEVGGGFEVPLTAELLNPAQVLQGGVAALIAEVSAQRTLERATGARLVGTAMDIRYVSMGRVGPIRATVDVVGGHDDLMAQVVLRDSGADDRVVTHNLLTFVAV